jgi:beta-N-acetylhexosaminidase
LSASRARRPTGVVFGCSGTVLTHDERDFFADANPLGFILFGRNIDHPDQVRALVADLRAAVGRADTPVLIDQEGGRVARLRPPHWRQPPAASRFGAVYGRDPVAGLEAARLNARLIAAELTELGIDVDCAPVLDLPVPGAHDVIGDRALGTAPAAASALGRAVCDGLLDGGVLPVIKHIPGHGRAQADSHLELPVVAAPLAELERQDFAPFKALADMPWAMTAHVRYDAVDPAGPATTSAKVIGDVIRRGIGFDGVLVSDDLGMKALQGSFAERARGALAAGCDIVLHCSGELAEMRQVMEGAGPIGAATAQRLARGAAMRRTPEPFDPAVALRRLELLIETAAA